VWGDGFCASLSRFVQHPLPDVLAAFGVELLAPLGGRFNRHWLVGSHGKLQVLRRWGSQPAASMRFEFELTARLAKIGWPVALQRDPVELDGEFWSLAAFLPGQSPSARHAYEPRARGRLLAELHADMAQINGLEPRPGWRRCEDILADPEIDRLLSHHEVARPEDVRVVRWHLDRARLRLERLRLEERSSFPIHGDFVPWNLLYEDGRLTGLLDFELSRLDHRVADFSLSWRGKYDSVIEGYEEVSPLEPVEMAALVPIWWAGLIEGFCRDLRAGRHDDGWTVGKLLTRSAMMGADASELP
jgi:Ser/Thr protein kinase RdoA (MazF antagonist)